MDRSKIHIVGPPRSGTTLMQALLATGFDIDGVTTHEEGLWRRGPRGQRILLTKCPGDEALASLLLPLDRHLWFVFMMRDPRDVVVSEHGQSTGKYWSNLRVWREALKFHAKMKGHRRFVVVRYEDLVTVPDAVQDELVRRMPFLKPAVPFSRYHEYLGAYARDIGKIQPGDARRSTGHARQHCRVAYPSAACEGAIGIAWRDRGGPR